MKIKTPATARPTQKPLSPPAAASWCDPTGANTRQEPDDAIENQYDRRGANTPRQRIRRLRRIPAPCLMAGRLSQP